MIVTKRVSFDMAHRITNHKGKCQNIHGHTYSMEVELEGPIVNGPETGRSDEGMVMDFGDLKTILDKYIVQMYDHSTMIWKEDKLLYPFFKELQDKGFNVHIMDFPTTAENMAKHFFEVLLMWCIVNENEMLKSVKVWETPSACAIYTFDNYREDCIKLYGQE